MARHFAASYEATPTNISLLRNEMAALARQCGLDAGGVADVKLAVSEAATNALLHGYREAGGGKIRVEAIADAGELQISICDDGPGMQPRTDSPGLGLGLPVMASVSLRLRIVEDHPGTEVHMAFRCPAAVSAPAS